MLKVYNVNSYVSIDGAKWREVGHPGYKVSEEDKGTELILDNASFDDVREFLHHKHLDGIWNDSTLFRSKPTIAISYSDGWDPVLYRHFDTMSYKNELTEWTTVSLDWIMKHLSADKCIQYLKEHGMTTCPILK